MGKGDAEVGRDILSGKANGRGVAACHVGLSHSPCYSPVNIMGNSYGPFILPLYRVTWVLGEPREGGTPHPPKRVGLDAIN